MSEKIKLVKSFYGVSDAYVQSLADNIFNLSYFSLFNEKCIYAPALYVEEIFFRKIVQFPFVILLRPDNSFKSETGFTLFNIMYRKTHTKMKKR